MVTGEGEIGGRETAHTYTILSFSTFSSQTQTQASLFSTQAPEKENGKKYLLKKNPSP
jgi:hypothetical protein